MGIMAVFALCGGVAVLITGDEFRSFRYIKSEPNDAFVALASGEKVLRSAWGHWTQSRLLRMCNRGMTAPVGFVLPRAKAETAARVCLEHGESAVRDFPLWGAAYASVALSASKLGQYDYALGQAKLSQDLSPYEGWLSQLRFGVLKSLPASDAVNAVLEREVSVLLDNGSYTAWLARKFARHPELRELIIRVAETKSGDVQGRFLTFAKNNLS